MRLEKLVHPESGLKTTKKMHRKPKPPDASMVPLQQVARAFLDLTGRVTYFKLTKLLYMFDLRAMKAFSRTYASDVYLRQSDGPWPPNLNKALKVMEGYEVRRWFRKSIPMVDVGPSPRANIQLDDDTLEIVGEVWGKFGSFSNSAIKSVVYRSEPMQFILAQEAEGKDMRNKAVLYKDKTAVELAEESMPSKGK